MGRGTVGGGRVSGRGVMIFIKALKALAIAAAATPLMGCALGIGIVFNGFLRGVAYAPELEDNLFSHAMLAFALIESFMVITLGIIVVIVAF